MIRCCSLIVLAAMCLAPRLQAADAPEILAVDQGDHIVLVGNTLAERMLYFGRFETLVYSRFADEKPMVRNLGWSADETNLQPRSKDFNDHGHTLEDHKPDILIGFWGFNESFAGERGVPAFKKTLTDWVKKSTTTKYNGESAPRVALVSPIAFEETANPDLPDAGRMNHQLEMYTDAMADVAEQQGILFVDLFRPTLKMFELSDAELTINGVHLNDAGYTKLAPILDIALFGPRPKPNGPVDLDALHAAVQEKNLQFYYDYRAVNGYYIYGGRKKPFGVVNFPEEFEKLRKMIANRETRIWKIAGGETVPETIDDSNTGSLSDIATNIKGEVKIISPEESKAMAKLPEGFELQLFASEVDFPALENPVSFAFDAKGRLFVTTMPSYPMYLPGKPVNDKILILEDTDGDGKADKQTVFAEGLHVPTGIEIGDGGVYVAQQPNLVFLKDTDGDDKADEKTIILHGFDSADSHHSISAFCWGPGGALYFQEGTFHHTQVETPWGPERLKDAGVFRYEPTTEKMDIFVSYRFANPWGHCFDKWGQNFVADASGGANYYGTAFSGDIDYPFKRGGLQQFLKKQWRPTCGCEIVSSRNFPEEMQGNYLLNNCIGFRGVLQYRMKDDGSGFKADPVEPLLSSEDPNFRPVDLELGPDGSLYLIDWYNPLIGHMQHSLRDPNRDKNHGRIWRVVYTEKDLVKAPKIAGESIPNLLELLKTPEDNTRDRVRRELRNFPTEKVIEAVDQWVAGLDESDPITPLYQLEALWVKQHHNAFDEEYLKQMLTSPEPKARAAATRVLCYWRDSVTDPLALLQQQVNDENGRVRLEAIRALSFFDGGDAAKAQEIAVESLIYDQDYYLKYTFQETMNTLDRRVKANR